ncbi:MAG: hypothetical protein CL521_03410 [Actinobacteria bacterium]|nr:hypothetical protein [Actinomycetota bacterium]
MDGIETANQIRATHNIPIIFLTAHAEEEIFSRAKITEPFGYVLKPFNDRDIHINIRIALYRHQVEKEIRDREKWISAVLHNIADAIIVVNLEQKVTYMNKAAEQLTNYQFDDAQDEDASKIFQIFDEENRPFYESPFAKVLRTSTPYIVYNAQLSVEDQHSNVSIDFSASALKNDENQTIGVVLGFRHSKSTHEFGPSVSANVSSF